MIGGAETACGIVTSVRFFVMAIDLPVYRRIGSQLVMKCNVHTAACHCERRLVPVERRLGRGAVLREERVERHFTSGEAVRDIVIGMSDGLTVPFALAAGLSGAVESTSIVISVARFTRKHRRHSLVLLAVKVPAHLSVRTATVPLRVAAQTWNQSDDSDPQMSLALRLVGSPKR